MTALEYLIKQCPRIESIASVELIDKAKKMEKEQIIDAYNAGDENGYWMAHSHNDKCRVTAEEYFQEIN
jgi:hypothetical protein